MSRDTLDTSLDSSAAHAEFATAGRTPVLIEDWLPIRELGIESVRESAPIPGQFPKLKTLHLWWARAPLAAAQGVMLAAALPVWSQELPTRVKGLEEAFIRVRAARPELRTQAADGELAYRNWVLWVSGIHGDPVAAETMKAAAKARGVKLKDNPYTYRPAFKTKPGIEDLSLLHRLLEHRWGRLPRVLDPTAGGGSLPFTALRYGFPTFANDLNPVAAGILDVALRAASSHGDPVLHAAKQWGAELIARCQKRLLPYFPSGENEDIANYLFVNSVRCPRTGGSVPLSPNWWIDKSGSGVAARPTPVYQEDGAPSELRFKILRDPKSHGFDPDAGTISGGDAVSPWDGLVVDGDYIKEEAQAGRMAATLYAVRVRLPSSGRKIRYEFRAPTSEDLAALEAAKLGLEEARLSWEAADVLPTEEIGVSNYDRGHRLYGIFDWQSMFTPRQLLVHGTFVEEWRRIVPEVRAHIADAEVADDVLLLLALMYGKALDYNSASTSWDTGRQKTRNTFDKHNYQFKWTFNEFEAPHELLPWVHEQVLDAFASITDMLKPDPGGRLDGSELDYPVPGSVTVTSRSASSLPHIADESIEIVNIDPPYYHNVQYAELADFFYVWHKRTSGVLRPDLYVDELCDKDNEAVANAARYADAGRRKNELAAFDYKNKMQAIFDECRRVLTADGVMVVWFTHKQAEAWDSLGSAMMEAGFTIEASWPVSTQPQTSLHHAKKNSAKSTVMLVCRKRQRDSDGVFFEDIEAEVRRAAVMAVRKFEADVGVSGVDLLLSTYGPTLSVISSRWPVLSSEAGEDGRARRLRPEEALSVAREEVNRLIKTRLVGHAAQFDPATDFWVLSWANFQARAFPYDEARKLGMSTGFDVEDAVDATLLKKKSGNVEIATPRMRARALRRKVGDHGRFQYLVDAVQYLLNLYRDDGLPAARTWLVDSGYAEERGFLDALQAAVNAVPRVRTKKGLSVPEAQELEDVVIALFGDKIEIPAEVEELIEAQQTSLEV